jgi:serine phosphatase RsbU (regulator of sigma subunit)
MVPRTPASVPDLDTAVRYVPGSAGLYIGGDWYDVVDLGPGRSFVSIGDVVGRGVQAGAVMSSVRSAVRAFVSEGHGPASVLDRVSRLIGETEPGFFATMVCGVLDRGRGELTFANAGHLPPLVCAGAQSCYLEAEVGPPVGALADARPYAERVVSLPAEGRLLLFTDGLIERRGESIDDGLDRLRAAAQSAPGPVEEFLDHITGQLREETARDDTAVLAVHWGG